MENCSAETGTQNEYEGFKDPNQLFFGLSVAAVMSTTLIAISSYLPPKKVAGSDAKDNFRPKNEAGVSPKIQTNIASQYQLPSEK